MFLRQINDGALKLVFNFIRQFGDGSGPMVYRGEFRATNSDGRNYSAKTIR
jgi:hypothetical protein